MGSVVEGGGEGWGSFHSLHRISILNVSSKKLRIYKYNRLQGLRIYIRDNHLLEISQLFLIDWFFYWTNQWWWATHWHEGGNKSVAPPPLPYPTFSVDGEIWDLCPSATKIYPSLITIWWINCSEDIETKKYEILYPNNK